MNRTEDLTLLGASGKKRLKFGNSLMSKLLGSSTNSEATANTLTKSPEKSTQLQNFLRDSQRSPNGNQEKKFLHNLIHDSVDKSDNFAVNSNGRVISVMISDSDYLGDDRIRPSDLRKLLYRRPEIAGILYDCLVEEGIVKDIQAPTSIETKDYMYEASETDSHDDNDHTEELNRNDDNSVFGVDHHSRDQESSDKGDFEDEPLTTEALVG